MKLKTPMTKFSYGENSVLRFFLGFFFYAATFRTAKFLTAKLPTVKIPWVIQKEESVFLIRKTFFNIESSGLVSRLFSVIITCVTCKTLLM